MFTFGLGLAYNDRRMPNFAKILLSISNFSTVISLALVVKLDSMLYSENPDVFFLLDVPLTFKLLFCLSEVVIKVSTTL